MDTKIALSGHVREIWDSSYTAPDLRGVKEVASYGTINKTQFFPKW